MMKRKMKLALASAAIVGLAAATYPASARISLNGASLNKLAANRIALNRIALNAQSERAQFDPQGVTVKSVTLPDGTILTAR